MQDMILVLSQLTGCLGVSMVYFIVLINNPTAIHTLRRVEKTEQMCQKQADDLRDVINRYDSNRGARHVE